VNLNHLLPRMDFDLHARISPANIEKATAWEESLPGALHAAITRKLVNKPINQNTTLGWTRLWEHNQ
jgi:hypothetical protein